MTEQKNYCCSCKCEDCRWYWDGECRKRAPVPYFHTGGNFLNRDCTSQWPRVRKNDFCGEFQSLQKIIKEKPSTTIKVNDCNNCPMSEAFLPDGPSYFCIILSLRVPHSSDELPKECPLRNGKIVVEER